MTLVRPIGFDSETVPQTEVSRKIAPHAVEKTPEPFHIPVLLDEVVEALRPEPGKVFFDGTLGAGGHSEALLERGASVIACDQDPEALASATARLRPHGDRFQGLRGNFRDIASLLEEAGAGKVDGILADLGVSSLHLDRADRGFSFRQDGPLDMRMNPDEPFTARDALAEWDEQELIRVFRAYGEEPQARRAAQAIVKERATKPLETTGELAALLEKTLGKFGPKHPGTRIFQALRIAVNAELDVLEDLLNAAPDLLNPGGRIAIITFHSLEDRQVKRDFRSRSQPWLDRPEWPAPKPNPACVYRLPGKSVSAGEEELARNPRSRSARLRVAERLPETPTPARR